MEYITNNGLPDLISFDHDLADGHYHNSLQEGKINYAITDFDDEYNRTGYHCAQFLVEYCAITRQKLPNFIVHSMNPVGSENIQKLLENYKKYNE